MQSGEDVGQHPHLNWFEFTSVSKGCGTVVTNGIESKVKKGDIFLSFPCDIHNIISSKSDPLEYDFIAFYCDDEHIDETLRLYSVFCHEGYYARMGAAWGISFLYIDYPLRTIGLLQSGTLDRFTHNKAIQKCIESYRISDEDKHCLRTLRR